MNQDTLDIDGQSLFLYTGLPYSIDIAGKLLTTYPAMRLPMHGETTVWVPVDFYEQEIKELRSDLLVATGVIIALLLALGYTWLQNQKMRRYFK